LATKIAEARTKIQQIRDRVAPYTYVPQYVYFKNTGEEVTLYTSWDSTGKMPFWKPTQVPPDFYITSWNSPSNPPFEKWVRVNWAQQLTSIAIDGKQLHEGFASFFVPGKSELFPYDQATIASYQGRLKQNPGTNPLRSFV
jgi:hypothetical protein